MNAYQRSKIEEVRSESQDVIAGLKSMLYNFDNLDEDDFDENVRELIEAVEIIVNDINEILNHA